MGEASDALVAWRRVRARIADLQTRIADLQTQLAAIDGGPERRAISRHLWLRGDRAACEQGDGYRLVAEDLPATWPVEVPPEQECPGCMAVAQRVLALISAMESEEVPDGR